MKLIFCSVVFIILGQGVFADDPPSVYIGASRCKRFYTPATQVTEAVVDYAVALQHVCRNIYGMELVAIQTMEEYQVLNRWFMNNFGNDSASPYFWTSGSKFGNNSLTWASTGTKYDLENVPMAGDWPAGCGCQDASPTYSWTKCLAIFKTCHPRRGGKEEEVRVVRAVNDTNHGETGLLAHKDTCESIQTMLYYRDCREKQRIICQRVVC